MAANDRSYRIWFESQNVEGFQGSGYVVIEKSNSMDFATNAATKMLDLGFFPQNKVLPTYKIVRIECLV